MTALPACVECGTVFEHGSQYRYRNGWRAAPVCRAARRCAERTGHPFRPCRAYTADGMVVQCGYVGCGYTSHATRAALS